MISEITIEAAPRTRLGKGGARQLRREGQIPITLYGGEDPGALALAVERRKMLEIFRGAAGRNTIFQLKVDGDVVPVIIKEWQVDRIKGTLMHADLLRISMTKVTRVEVPVVLEGEAYGVKTEGGILDFATYQVEVECLPGDIPDRIRLDVSTLRVGQHISVKELDVGERVRVLEDPDRVVVSVLTPRVEEIPAPAVVEGAPTEPEVIKKGKEVGEEAPEK